MAKGQTIDMMEGLYQYEIPPIPNDEKLIDGYMLAKKDQMWRRPVIPSFKSLSEKDKIEVIELHRDRWLNGYWFFNNGEPTWITGIHYDFLTFCDFEDFGGPPAYLDQQRLDFYFRDLVRQDTRTYGQVILKCRRCGMTAEDMCQAVYTLLEDFNSKIGLQSNELQKKCIPELMLPIINMYLKRPKWMRSPYYSSNNKKPRNKLELTPSTVDDEDEFNDENSEYMGGTIIPYPTTPAAMDGSKKRYIIMDEVWKWLICSPLEALGINKKCVVQYGIKGKISMLSTMGDSDQYHEAVLEGTKIWAESNPRIRDNNGRTTSGLYKWFVPAIHSADIPEEHRDVKYGKVNKEKAEEYIWNEVNKHTKDSKNYVFELRRMPMKEEHALLAASGKSYFPVIRMQSRLNQLNELPKDQKPYVRGNLVEVNGRVKFEHDEVGIWLVSILPYVSVEKNINTGNRFRVDHKGNFHPPINPEFVGGYDPIRYKKDNTVSNNLSKACGIIYKLHDYFGSGISNEYAALMLYRPNDPNDAHYEMVKAAKFWGCPIMAERQVETTETIFDQNKMMAFLMLNPKDNKWGIWTDSQGKVVENGVQVLVTQFSAPKNPEDKDQVSCYPFEDGLLDYMSFDIANTTQSHITMADIMRAKGGEQLPFMNISDENVRNYMQRVSEITPALR